MVLARRAPFGRAAGCVLAACALVALALSLPRRVPVVELAATARSGPFWRMPRGRAGAARTAAPRGAQRTADLQHLLAEHPKFVKEWAALAKHAGARELAQALRAHTARQPTARPPGARDARLLQRQRQKRVRQLVMAKRQMLAKQLLAEDDGAVDGDNSTGSAAAFPAEHGAFNDWVLTLKPAAINMSNATWGVWRTPDNSNAYSGMTAPVPNTNPFGEQIIDQDSDKYVNISDIEKGYDTYNPLFAALEGKGFPKMGYEQDIFAPCTDPTKCTPPNSRPNNPVRDTHSDPRALQAKEEKPLSLSDEYKNCSDPNNPEYYTAMCDPARNKYGRPIREGGFPDDPMIVEWRLHTQRINQRINRSVEVEKGISGEGNWTIYREPVYLANAQAPHALYLRTPFPAGVSKQPYTSTGYYGGLSGPPFITEVPKP